MTQPSLSEEQEAKLAEALEITLLKKERAKELSVRGDANALEMGKTSTRS